MKFYQSFDGLNLAYRDEGDGPPLLCLSGLTRNSTDFDYLAPHLPNTRLIRLDYRGRGASDWSTDPATYSWDVEARDVLDLLDHLNIPQISILGTSRGGMIAMYLAANARDRLAGVCLNDIGPELTAGGLDRIKTYVGKPPTQKTHQQLAIDLPTVSPDFRNVPASRWREEAQHRTIETADGLTLTYDPDLCQRMDPSLVQVPPDLWGMFDALKGMPLALIRGENSDILSPECAAEMCRRQPDMLFTNVADRGHIPYLDEPEALSVIARWWEACT